MSDLASRYKWLDDNGIVLKQHREEIGFVYREVGMPAPQGWEWRVGKPQTIVEVGSMAGASLYVYAGLLAQTNGLAIAVDDGRRQKYRTQLKRVIRAINADAGRACSWVRGDSHAKSTREALKVALNGRPIDFLHIDGDHSAAGSYQDWKMYGPLVREGGIVAFHDIRATAPCHVDETWQRICNEGYLTRAICKGRFKSTPTSRLHKPCGIGMVYV